MKRQWIPLICAIFTLGFTFQVSAQLKNLQIKSPAKSHFTTTAYNQYLQGIADPSAFLFMNGEPIKIYSTGVFAAQIPLKLGENNIEITYVKDGDTLKRNYTIQLVEAAPLNPTTSFEIENIQLNQGGDIWLQKGELLQVEAKALPGMKMIFLDNQPMEEVDEKHTGVKGIYRGSYKIKENDNFQNLSIEFSLINTQTQQKITKKSNDKVSVLDSNQDLIGITKVERTALNYGLGNDRLGGAKIGFLPKGIKVKIIGKMKGMYKVQLAKDRIAYIPDNQIELLKGVHFKPESLTGSWSVRPSNRGDLITIGLTEKLPFTSQMVENPSKIIIDVFGAASNSNWITQKENLKAIQNVWYEQINEEIFRVHIQLKHAQHWGYDIDYIGNNLTIRVKPQPENLSLKNLKIALDAGHGANNLGAVGMTGVREKDLNLIIVNKVKDLLIKRGAEVILTREGDTYTQNSKRLEFLKDVDPDLLISVHCNAAGNPLVQGASTYYRHQAFRPLSQFIYSKLLNLELSDFGNVGGFNFALNAPTQYPNTLVEVAFMSNPSDEERLLDPDFQSQVANSIVLGIENFLKSIN